MDKKIIINISIMDEAKSLMGDKFPTMVKYFFEDTEMYFQEIEKAINAQNAEIAILPAHTIKSSAKQMGAEEVSNIAKEIEEICRGNNNVDFAKLKALHSNLRQAIDVSSAELKKLLNLPGF